MFFISDVKGQRGVARRAQLAKNSPDNPKQCVPVSLRILPGDILMTPRIQVRMASVVNVLV